MSQISLFGASEDLKTSQPDLKPTPAPKQSEPVDRQIALSATQKVKIQRESIPLAAPQPARYGHCRICGRKIAIPGLDANLCSNPACTCGSSGWVVDPQWLAANPPRGRKGGVA